MAESFMFEGFGAEVYSTEPLGSISSQIPVAPSIDDFGPFTAYKDWISKPGSNKILIMQAGYGVQVGNEIEERYFTVGTAQFFHYDIANPENSMAITDRLTDIPYITTKLGESNNISSLEFANTGDLDEILYTYYWAGRPIKLYLGDTSWNTWSNIEEKFVCIFSGIIEEINFLSENQLSFVVKDKRSFLDVKLETETLDQWCKRHEGLVTPSYLIKVEDVEGLVPVAGKDFSVLEPGDALVPTVIGRVFNVTPAVLDPEVGIFLVTNDYVVSDRNGESIMYPRVRIDEVRAGGVPLIEGDDWVQYSSIINQDALLQNHPLKLVDPLELRVLVNRLPQGVFVLLAPTEVISYGITCDVSPFNFNKQIYYHVIDTESSVRWLIRKADTIDYANSINPGIYNFTDTHLTGMYITSEQRVLNVIQSFAEGAGAHFSCDRLGRYMLSKVREVTQNDMYDNPTAIIYEDDILEGSLMLSRIDPPSWRIKLAFLENSTVQAVDSLRGKIVDPDVPEKLVAPELIPIYKAIKKAVTQEHFIYSQEDSFIKKVYPIYNKYDDDVKTLYQLLDYYWVDDNAYQAAIEPLKAEAMKRFNIGKQFRYTYSLVVNVKPFTFSIGDMIKVYYPRYEFENGKNAIVVSLTENAVEERVNMEIWF